MWQQIDIVQWKRIAVALVTVVSLLLSNEVATVNLIYFYQWCATLLLYFMFTRQEHQ